MIICLLTNAKCALLINNIYPVKKFENLIKENLITKELIEDNLLSLKEDLGYDIKQQYHASCLYSDGKFNGYNMYSYSPDYDINYPCFLFSLSKKVHIFSVDNTIYDKTIEYIKSIEKRIPLIRYSFTFGELTNMYVNDEKKLILTLIIVDKLNPYNQDKIKKLKYTKDTISTIFRNKEYGKYLSPYTSVGWEEDHLKCNTEFDGSRVHANEHDHYIRMCGILRDTIQEELPTHLVSELAVENNQMKRRVKVSFTIKKIIII